MSFSIVIPICYESQKTVYSCLDSVQKQNLEQIPEIVIVDNCAQTSFRERFTNIVDRYIRLSYNTGYAAACNAGVKQATREFVLLLNPDTQLNTDAIAKMGAYLEEHPKCGLVGPELRYPGGSRILSVLPEPSPWQFFCQLYPVQKIVPNSACFEQYRRAYNWEELSRPTPVDWVAGAAMGVRREDYFALGGMEEQFGLYMEEVDLCLRVRKQLGKEVHFLPGASIEHQIGEGSRNLGEFPVYNALRSRFLFARRYFSRLECMVTSLLLVPPLLVSLFRHLRNQSQVDTRGHPCSGSLREFVRLLAVLILQVFCPGFPMPESILIKLNSAEEEETGR